MNASGLFAHAIDILKPKAFVLENVKALAALSRWNGVRERLMEELSTIGDGYNVKVVLLNACDHGVPQSRERVFFIGTAAGFHPVGSISSVHGKSKSVGDTLRTLPIPGEPPNIGECKAKVVPAKRPILRKSPYAGMLFNGQGRPIKLDGYVNTLPASMGGNRTPIVDELELRNGEISWVVEYHKKLFKGEEPIDVAPNQLRRLTVTECSILQGFPLGYKFIGKQSSQYRQIGNAVPPPLAQSVARAVASTLNRGLTNSKCVMCEELDGQRAFVY